MSRKHRTTNRRPRRGAAGRPPETPPRTATSASDEPLGLYGRFMIAMGLITGATGLVLLLVWFVEGTTPGIRAVWGDEGAHGTAVVVSCVTTRTNSGRTWHYLHDCKARFEFDDLSKQPIVIDTIPEVEVGQIFPAVLLPGEDRVLPSEGSFGIASAILLPTAMATLLPAIVCFVALVRRSRTLVIWSGAVTTSFIAVVVWAARTIA